MRAARYLMLAGLLVLVILLLAEVALRVLVEMRPSNYAYDPDWGWRPATGSHVLWGREGYGHTSYSHNGELATPYDDGPNIVVLGDSHTEAYQVDSNYSFVSVAEQEVRQRGLTVNLRNLGASNVALPDYVYLAPLIRQEYKPELVVIQLSTTDFLGADAFNPAKMNYFVPGESGLRVVHQPPTYRDHWLGKVMNGSSFITEWVRRYRTLGPGKQQAASAAPDVESDKAMAELDAQLNALADAYQDLPLAIVLLPYVPTVEGGVLVQRSADYETLRAALSTREEWYLLDPLPQFQELAGNWVLPRGFPDTRLGTGHLNRDGHAVVGHLLAEQIEAQLR